MTEIMTPIMTGTVTITHTPTETQTPTPTAVPTETVEPLTLALYWYDGQGNLTRAEVNGVVTLYVSPNYVVEIDDTVETTQKYYSFGSMRVAIRTIAGETDTLQCMLYRHVIG